jgi:hypothetical protein
MVTAGKFPDDNFRVPDPERLPRVVIVKVDMSSVPPLLMMTLCPVVITLALRMTVKPFRITTTSPLTGTALPVRLSPDGSVVQVPAAVHKPLLPPFV